MPAISTLTPVNGERESRTEEERRVEETREVRKMELQPNAENSFNYRK
jgi:hypothetical protein